jgi:two-component system, cell cycle response regulator
MNVKLESDDRLIGSSLLCLQCPSSRLPRLLLYVYSSIGERMLESAETLRTGVKEDTVSANGEQSGYAHLVVLQGPGLGDFYFLNGAELVLGSDPCAELVLGSDPFLSDVVVRDVEVEPRHASIHRDHGSGTYVVRDLGTGEDTVINHESFGDLEERSLRDGDRIVIGDSVLEFSQGDPVKAQFHASLDRLINRDHLTGLLAKKRFDEEFEHRLDAAIAASKPLSVLMADIDNLKKINDRHGHLLGEFVVGTVGRIIGELHDGGDRQATRFGGDEYQTILPGLDKAEAVAVAEEIRRRVDEYAFEQGGTLTDPTLSIGVAAYPEDGATRNTLTHAADEALYRAKRAGGNVVSE